ncbi:MAG: hypothetical protein KDA24_16610, partial [Deltaproteobacteria bacterium]|nr:hypothetical protein [Deltaproteobacteria bacterium]
MKSLRLVLILALLPALAITSGCANDCDTFCSRQARYIDGCLPEFDSVWTDLNADWQNRGDFVATCNEQVDDAIADDIEATCANAVDADATRTCETTVRQGIYDSCSDDLNKFQQSCTDYWTGETEFLPGTFDPPPFPSDDDDSAGDDDDSAGDDDDSAGDDDDSAGDDDDSAGDDDDYAGDDDDSAGDDDDSAGDDDDSAGDDD